ncbi:hypothetical protein PDK26_10775 [Bacillus cereus]|uniref:DUF6630 family protein n=1 Tax=Bacillus cereus group TaxID=86661 RepID=UPI001F56B840|nr:hypothetical protein [Bacillus cereus]MDA1611713.1 hypothetical protein [Bacillus cereus]MDF9474823.1 hypothetical protein [Bacillus cereus]MDF9496852.1 hypothetical protein [Bacillus cereus]MDF9518365.1 hypothetical protein [Bacillus cereus]MDF9567303.1 hypothetical protein [Bacillus cereus]
MPNQEIAQIIFPDSEGLETFLKEQGGYGLHENLLKYGLMTKLFLYVDYKGEQYQEIVNFMLNYEFTNQIELATQEELEKLEAFNYDYLPEKIELANKILSPKGYGLFSYPNSGDFFALFIAKIEDIIKFLQEEVLFDDRIPFQERCIKYYK